MGRRQLYCSATLTTSRTGRRSKAAQAETGNVAFGTNNGGNNDSDNNSIAPRLIAALFRGEKLNGMSLYTRAMASDFPDAFELAASKKLEYRRRGQIRRASDAKRRRHSGRLRSRSEKRICRDRRTLRSRRDESESCAGDDKIWNGADDDGSGTVAVMAIAEAMSKGPRPKRSILFIWHAGEEKGLWGSEYFADNPTVPINSIVTQLNIDMIGRYQNPGDENHPQNKTLPKAGRGFPDRLANDEHRARRSERQRQQGDFSIWLSTTNTTTRTIRNSSSIVPIISTTRRKASRSFSTWTGATPIITRSRDSIEKINFESMEKVTRTIFATGWELANRATRPKVDKPLPASVIAGN